MQLLLLLQLLPLMMIANEVLEGDETPHWLELVRSCSLTQDYLDNIEGGTIYGMQAMLETTRTQEIGVLDLGQRHLQTLVNAGPGEGTPAVAGVTEW